MGHTDLQGAKCLKEMKTFRATISVQNMKSDIFIQVEAKLYIKYRLY